MANTYTQIYIQVVFAVEWRQSLISPEHKEELHKYISGIVRNQGQKLIEIDAQPDHLHMLVGMKPDLALSDLVREVKKSSTNFINGNRWVRGRFNWQPGFGGFSYSRSHLNAVIRYIQNQDQHHAKRSFKQEYKQLLRKFDIAFEEKYLFDFRDE
jgi:REP element-mobilizing transposase RayT